MKVDVKHFAELLPKPHFDPSSCYSPEPALRIQNLDRFMENQSSEASRQRRLAWQHVVREKAKKKEPF